MDCQLPPDTMMGIHCMMGAGLGYEDIAVKLGIDAKYIRREAARLRGVGMLHALYHRWRE